MTSEGRVWKFGDDVNTDLIIPGKYLDDYDPDHLASHAMEGVSKSFASEVHKGDIVLAGMNFGCGSSREQAVTALKQSGVSCVVAQSFARIFYRNAVNLGLIALESEEAQAVFEDGDNAVLRIDESILESADGTKKAILKEMPARAMDIIRSGGLVPHIKAKLVRTGAENGPDHPKILEL